MTALIYLIVGISGFSCSRSQFPKGTPECIIEKMRSWTSVRALPADAVVMQYDYNGEVVYYFPSPCCDQYNYVYNRECEVICAPDGGITGAGDQHCTDFFDEAKNGVVLLKHGEEIK